MPVIRENASPSPNCPPGADTTPPDPAKVGRYRSHRREVEALQWQSTHESFEAIVAFTGDDAVRWSGGPTLLLRGSNGGAATADLGDWIIKNDDGAFEVYPRVDFSVMFSPIADAAQITPEAAAHVLWFYDEGGMEPSSFKQVLIALIDKADPPNRHKLRQQWPEYVAAVEEIQTPGSGAEALRVIAEKLQQTGGDQ